MSSGFMRGIQNGLKLGGEFGSKFMIMRGFPKGVRPLEYII